MQIGDFASVFIENPVLTFIVVVLLGFVFFLYLFLRRTAQEFKEGMQGDR
ncbi:MAG: hypothetical protein ABEJ26_02035 [Halosimplex sp.]